MIKTEFKIEKYEKGEYCCVFMDVDKKHNIITEESIKRFANWMAQAEKDDSIKSVIMTSHKRSFATGLDINMFQKTKAQIKKFVTSSIRYIDSIEKSDKIFIAAVDGYCLGGGLEIIMATDYIISTPDAVFGLPEIKLGIVPGADGIKRLVRQIGRRRAIDLLLTGKMIKAKEALSIGLINEIVPRRKLMKRSKELATNIASNNHEAIKATKYLVNKATTQDITKEEIDAFIKCLSTDHAKRSIEGFLEKSSKKR